MPAERDDIFAVCNSNTAPHFIPERDPIEYVDDGVFISLVRDLSACHLLVRDTAIRAYDLSMITERIHTSVTSRWRYVADYKDKESAIRHQIHLTNTSKDTLELEARAISVFISENHVHAPLMHKGLYETQRDIQRANSERGYIICAYKQRYIETVQEYQSLSESTWNLNLRYFNNILGLKFSSNGGTIMVAFCRLSQTEPEKEGYIILGITGNNMRGLSSVPHVQEFDTLIDQLDKGLAFGVFLCRVRNAFRALL